jgi:Uri superfamily endonuclease
MIATLPGVEPSVRNFGSSDCKCRTHLFRTIAGIPDFDTFKEFCRKAEKIRSRKRFEYA